MLWAFLEVLLNLVLLGFVGLFLRLYPVFDYLSFGMMVLGFVSLCFLLYRGIQGARGSRRPSPPVRHRGSIRKATAATSLYSTSQELSPKGTVEIEVKTPFKKGVSGEKTESSEEQSAALSNSIPMESSIKGLEFLDSPTLEESVVGGYSNITDDGNLLDIGTAPPFLFVVKKPLGKGVSQLRAIDDLVTTLPRGFKRCLILSDLKLNSKDGCLLELLGEGRKIDTLICQDIYRKIDLIPQFGNLRSCSLLTQKRLVKLLEQWLQTYDLIVFQLGPVTMVDNKTLLLNLWSARFQESTKANLVQNL